MQQTYFVYSQQGVFIEAPDIIITFTLFYIVVILVEHYC